MRRRRFEADDLVTSQRLEKRLEAATDGAAQDVTVNFDLAHS